MLQKLAVPPKNTLQDNRQGICMM